MTKSAGPSAERIDLPDRLLVPGLVNAHAHLDLTGLGPRSYGGDFIEWVKMVMAERPGDPEMVKAAVKRGAERSRAAGVMTVGDIAGIPEATEALRESPLGGVSYTELFGAGGSAMRSVMRMLRRVGAPERAAGVTVGLQPHAPYSCLPELCEQAVSVSAASRVPICIHLAETPEELEFIAEAGGAFRSLLERLGKWEDGYSAFYGQGKHPVEWLADATAAKPQAAWLCAHCNYVEGAHIELMAERGWSVAYCPRASDYFGHRGHRYRDMLAAGVNVCLGTDSILCHGTLSILDEMRHLYQRDGTDPDLLLRMATVNGMRGLGLAEEDATFSPGAAAGIMAIRYDARPGVEPLEAVLGGERRPDVRVLEMRG